MLEVAVEERRFSAALSNKSSTGLLP